MIPFDMGAFGASILESVRRGRINRRVLTWLGGLGAIELVSRALLEAAHVVDDRVAPTWRDTPVDEPVFILTGPRSGTTRMHGLLALDEKRFTSLKLYQSFFPSISFERLVSAVEELDSTLLGGRLRARLEAFNAKLVPRFQDKHRIGINRYEEDESLFVHSFVTPTSLMLFPFVERFGATGLDDKPDAFRRRFMDFYVDSLRRHVYAAGGERTLLTKNVWMADRLDSLLGAFPDARVIFLVRHPYDTIASGVSMFTTSWEGLFPDRPKDSPEFAEFARLIMRYQLAYYGLEKRLPSSQFKIVLFEELISDPKACVTDVYDHFGWDMPGALKAKLEEENAAQQKFRSSHDYSLEQYGIDPREVYETMKPIFDRFGFDPQI